MQSAYVEERDGGLYVAGKRISLDSIVYAFNRGASPESIMRSFPLLTLEEVYGAVTYYLAHKAEVDEYLSREEAEFEKIRREQREQHPEFYAKFDAL
jgi:uncharacterized protein (DUF433 family)